MCDWVGDVPAVEVGSVESTGILCQPVNVSNTLFLITVSFNWYTLKRLFHMYIHVHIHVYMYMYMHSHMYNVYTCTCHVHVHVRVHRVHYITTLGSSLFFYKELSLFSTCTIYIYIKYIHCIFYIVYMYMYIPVHCTCTVHLHVCVWIR